MGSGRPGGRGLVALLICSVITQFLAAYLSFRFVLLRRLGKPWVLVSCALLVMGGMQIYSLSVWYGDPAPASVDQTFEVIGFAVSFLLCVGFALTERWFLLKERLERRFRLIADVDRALIGVLDEKKIFSVVCEGLVREQGYTIAWIGTANPDGSITVVESAGEGQGFISEIPLRWNDTPEGNCPAGAAVRSGEMCVVNRMAEHPHADPWRDAARKYGIGSFASLRIDVKRTLPLVLTLGSEREDVFDRLEREAIGAMASCVGTALFSAKRHEYFVCAKKSYGELLHSQRDGVVLVRGGVIVRANPAGAKMLGYPSMEELLGKDPAALFPDAGSSPGISRILGSEAEDREPFLITQMQRKDGSRFEGEIMVTWVPRAARNEEGEPKLSGPLGMLIFRDVTLRTQTLEELRKERDFSAKILDATGVLVLEIGLEGEILLFNRQCEEVTGYAAAETIGRKMTDFLLPEPAVEFHREGVGDVLSGRSPMAREYALLTKTGEERVMVWNYAPIPGPDDKVSSILLTGTDITERRRLELAIVSMQKMEAVGTLAGGVAHDFNNILTGILGNLDLARKRLPPDSAAVAAIGKSIRASERAAHLIRQLLEFSRRSSLERRVTDMGKVVREVVHLVSQTIDKRIEVVGCADDDLWNAKVDSNQVHQVLMNLCVNARDAIMEQIDDGQGGYRKVDGKTIWVRAENVTIVEEYCRAYPYARPGEFVVLSVADNGIGMDAVTQRRVFEPFFTTKRLGRGTGLGLSTVYGIVKQHEGWITLDSEPGTGTTFRCYFPRSSESLEEVTAVPGPNRHSRGKETILFVDDEEMIRDLGVQILTMQGYRVLTAGDGPQAIEMFLAGGETVDLVLLDLTMPNMSGLEVLEQMRKINPRVKVVLSSGHRADEAHSQERISGASAFLAKPYRAEVLTRIVREVLDGMPS
jgi:two-component system cell cycle sensor histidine kinase/response regulator CckA